MQDNNVPRCHRFGTHTGSGTYCTKEASLNFPVAQTESLLHTVAEICSATAWLQMMSCTPCSCPAHPNVCWSAPRSKIEVHKCMTGVVCWQSCKSLDLNCPSLPFYSNAVRMYALTSMIGMPVTGMLLMPVMAAISTSKPYFFPYAMTCALNSKP